MMHKAVNIIILSRNRAAQLDLLLSSLACYMRLPGIYHVLYTYDKGFRAGYNRLHVLYPQAVNFVREKDFRADVLGLLNEHLEFTLFLCDDHVVKAPITDPVILDYVRDPDVLCASLRLGLNIDWGDRPVFTPLDGDKMYYSWEWKAMTRHSWGYPMSLPSHIYKTKDLIDYLDNLGFSNPNTLEGAMANRPLHHPLMVCGFTNKIVELHVNRVQTANQNQCGHIAAEYLERHFTAGKRLALAQSLDKLPDDKVQLFVGDLLAWR